LSDSRKYKGGEFYVGTLPYDSIPFITEEDPNATIPFYGELYYYKPRQYSAIVFLSFLHHRVTDVNENGTRETLPMNCGCIVMLLCGDGDVFGEVGWERYGGCLCGGVGETLAFER
jgi:hypothetical protein